MEADQTRFQANRTEVGGVRLEKRFPSDCGQVARGMISYPFPFNGMLRGRMQGRDTLQSNMYP